MKTAIYTIALNEELHAETFMNNCKEADLILVGDTGSTDRTREIIQDMGGTVVPVCVIPWRFDVPRNVVLSLLPADIDFCMALDLDERMSADWRDAIDDNWRPEHNRFRFHYIHNFRDDGTPGTVGIKDFAHARGGYMWRHAVHEMLYYVGEGEEQILTLPEFVIEHRQDLKKPRAYTELLELESKDPKTTPRHIFWLIREYLYVKKWVEVLEFGKRFLAYEDTWNVEEAHCWRYMAKALAHLGKADDALAAHFQAIERAPREREVWMDLGWYYHGHNKWAQAYGAVCQCLSITDRPEHYLSSDEVWDHKPHELAAMNAIELGLTAVAKEHMITAIRMSPRYPHLKALAAKMGFEDIA